MSQGINSLVGEWVGTISQLTSSHTLIITITVRVFYD
jgi:hypothetical protein